MNGQLSEQPLAELLREINASGMSGALRLGRGRVQAVVYAQAGAIIYARSNLRAHRLPACLERWGVLSAAEAAGVAHITDDAEAVATLKAAGRLAPEDLPALRVRQAADVLRPLLLWTDGAWSFDARARLAEETAGGVRLAELLLEAARRLPLEFVAARLADDDSFAPNAASSAELALQPAEGFILSRVDAPLTFSDLAAVSGLPEAETRRHVYALALAGLLTRAHWPRTFDEATRAQARAAGRATTPAESSTAPAHESSRPLPSSAAPQPAGAAEKPKQSAPPSEADPRVEVAALLARVRNADYYQTLGVTRAADARTIKRAYYALAKRFHPDRFRRNIDDAMRTRAEAAFAQIAQAYETLSDEKTRAAYDAKLTPETSHRPARAATPKAQFDPEPTGREVDPEESFQHGLAAYKQANYHTALIYFADAARRAPRQARYRAYHGHTLAQDPRLRRQGEAELRAAIALDADNATYHVMLAELYQMLGLQRRAEGELTRALGLDPQHMGARQLLRKLKSSDK